MVSPRILIVEDEAIIAEDLKIRLTALHYTITGIAATGPQAITLATAQLPDLILMDIVLKGEMDGIKAAGLIRENHDIPVIYLTAYSDNEILKRAMETEPYGYLIKPLKDREVHATIKMALVKHHLELDVKESRDWFSATLKCIGDAVIVTNPNGTVTFLNKVAEEMTGWQADDALGKELHEIFSISATNQLQTTQSTITTSTMNDLSFPTKKGEIKHLSGILLTKNRSEIPVEDSLSAIHDESGTMIGTVVIFRDITAQKRATAEKTLLESQLRQSQKMEAIGTLAGGIAHDFNNLLAIILGYADMLKEDTPAESKQHQQLENILTAGFRAKDLIKQILSFSRQSSADRIPLMPGPIVKETLKMLRSSIPANIEIRQDIASLSSPILIDPTQFSQIIINLCTNAYQAMAEQYGVLEVILKQVMQATVDLEDVPPIPPGEYIKITINDTGIGIHPENLEKIFEPYFTTKDIGKGTGLGLATVHGIVKEHGGLLKVNSTSGKGSRFQVFFPVVRGKPPAIEEDLPMMPPANQHILLVDDEPMLAEMGRDMLERLGYCVELHNSGTAALKIFSNKPDTFDLVITDQAMPEMTGTDLAAKLLQIRPDIPIILCTGFSETVSREKALALGFREYVMKPLVKKELAKVVSQVLTK